MSVVRATWILLFNVDMRMKELALAPCDQHCVAKAIPPLPVTGNGGKPVPPGPEYALRAMVGVNHAKARRFYMDLHNDVVPQWLENQILGPTELVRLVTSSYLNS